MKLQDPATMAVVVFSKLNSMQKLKVKHFAELCCILLGCWDFNFLLTNGFSNKPQVKLLAEEQKATEGSNGKSVRRASFYFCDTGSALRCSDSRRVRPFFQGGTSLGPPVLPTFTVSFWAGRVPQLK